MFLVLEEVVPASLLARLRASLRGTPSTPDDRSALVKRDAFVIASGGEASVALSVVAHAIASEPRLGVALRPAAFAPPEVFRYAEGAEELEHSEPELVSLPRVRADIGLYVALTEGAAADGGELSVDFDGVRKAWQPTAGSCFAFPAGARRRVSPVTRGERCFAVFWLQSLVREASARRVLFDLARATEGLEGTLGRTPQVESLKRVSADLLRLWAEPARVTSSGGGG